MTTTATATKENDTVTETTFNFDQFCRLVSIAKKFKHDLRSNECKACASKRSQAIYLQCKTNTSKNARVIKKAITKRKRSEVNSFIESCILQAKYTRSEIIALCVDKFKDKALSTFATILSDSKNEKYFKMYQLRCLTKVDAKTKIMSFTDRKAYRDLIKAQKQVVNQ